MSDLQCSNFEICLPTDSPLSVNVCIGVKATAGWHIFTCQHLIKSPSNRLRGHFDACKFKQFYKESMLFSGVILLQNRPGS